MYFKLALGNVRKSFRDYGIYFITLLFGVCVFYAFNSIASQQAVLQFSESQNRIIELLAGLIDGTSVFIAIILGFLIVYASRYLIRRRKKEFGTYLTLGMPVGKVSRIVVYETLLVGVASLLVGLALGIAISQALLYVTAALFTIQVDALMFVFSYEAMIKTIIYFGVIFFITLVFNVFSISRYKLIDLINADRKNESIKLRSLPLSVVLFIISLALIGTAYYLLIDNGLVTFDSQFATSTVLVCVGTLLFFYSLSGFLLRAVQSNRKLYFRGLNMFVLRQLNSKINTTFISITLVSMALFLAITSTCGGTALANAFTQNLAANTQYDATLSLTLPGQNVDRTGQAPKDEGNRYSWYPQAAADNFDMLTTLKRSIPEWDTYVSNAAQMNSYQTGMTMKDLADQGQVTVKDDIYGQSMDQASLNAITVSEFNKQRTLLGLEPVDLGSDKFLLWCNFEEIKYVYEQFLAKSNTLNIFDTTLTAASNTLETMPDRTSSIAGNTGIVVVPDHLINEKTPLASMTLNLMYSGERADVEPKFESALYAAFPGPSSISDNARIWPFMTSTTAMQMEEQASGLTALIAYLAVYIGFILLVTCAAILALQQLSEAADNVSRYHLLEEIGVERKMTSKAVLVQIAIYFLFPLIVAFCHSLVALNVVVKVVSMYGYLDIALPLLMTVGAFLVLYLAYFLFTFFASRTMLNQKAVV